MTDMIELGKLMGYLGAEALRSANAAQETGALGNSENAARVVIAGGLNIAEAEIALLVSAHNATKGAWLIDEDEMRACLSAIRSACAQGGA